MRIRRRFPNDSASCSAGCRGRQPLRDAAGAALPSPGPVRVWGAGLEAALAGVGGDRTRIPFGDRTCPRSLRSVAGAGPRVGPPELKTAPPGGGAVFSAGDRTRTGTRLPARDFKSLVSTIPPHRHGSNTISRRGKGVKPSRAEKRCKPGGKKGQPG